MERKHKRAQYVRRVVAGGLCLLTLYRPLKITAADTAFEPLPVAQDTAMPSAQPEQTMLPNPVTSVVAAPTDAPTAGPEQTAAEPAKAQPVDQPANAYEDASFHRGYARMLGAGEARVAAHERKTAYPVIALQGNEIVLVKERVSYVSTKAERKAQKESGEVFIDWFLIQVRDAQGNIVEGYVPGTSLFPLTQEETEALRLAWEEEAKEAREALPQAEDGIPAVTGLLLPPPEDTDTESTANPEDAEATTEPTATPENAEPTSEPTETPQDTEPTPEPTEIPQDAEPTPEPTEIPQDAEPTPQPTDIPQEDPAEAALAQARALLDAQPQFVQNAEAYAMLLSVPTPDTYAPTIGPVNITYELNGPVQVAVLSVQIADEQDPGDPAQEVSGIVDVYVIAPDGNQYECSYNEATKCYEITVYRGDPIVPYTIHAVDGVGLISTKSVMVDHTLLAPANPMDDEAPTIVSVTLDPPVEKRETVDVLVDALDTAPGGLTPSGIREVWITTPSNLRLPCTWDADSGLFIGEALENGVHTVWVKDAAGNTASQGFTVANILDPDTYPPTILSVITDPERDPKGGKTPMAMLICTAIDERRPASSERATGVDTVEVGLYYGLDPVTNQPVVAHAQPMFLWEDDQYAYTLEENGDYMVVVTDKAGNKSYFNMVVDFIGEVKPRKPDPNWAYRPLDDDGDGLFTQTEYRLGINPASKDTNADGLWDGLCVRLGINAGGNNGAPVKSVVARAQDTVMLDALVAAGKLVAPLGEKQPNTVRQRVRKAWSGQSSSVVWMNALGSDLLCINNMALFTASIPRSEAVEVGSALMLSTLGMGYVNNNVFRTVEPCADGSMLLLYDRKEHGGTLTKDAFLVDVARMQAYRIPETAGARDLAISDDGAMLAIWKTDSLTRLSLKTGEALVLDDAQLCGRIEMVRFLADGTLVTRVSSIGYSAIDAKGEPQIGSAEALPCLVQFQDIKEMTIFDRNMSAVHINLQAQLRRGGVFVTGEPEKEKPVRNLSPRDMYERVNGGAHGIRADR